MTIYIGSDHAGYKMKAKIVNFLKHKKISLIDLGTNSTDSVDYPDYAEKVAKKVSKSKNAKGILICGSGIGVCIAANKVKGIRAASIYSPSLAELSIKHNNINILCLSGKLTTFATNKKIIEKFLTTKFEGGRHSKRIAKIASLEK